jgi:Proton-conducting membrane transporter
VIAAEHSQLLFPLHLWLPPAHAGAPAAASAVLSALVVKASRRAPAMAGSRPCASAGGDLALCCHNGGALTVIKAPLRSGDSQ